MGLTKRISAASDLTIWTKSPAYEEITGLILRVNHYCQASGVVKSELKSEEAKGLVQLLTMLQGWIDEIPPLKDPQRFGNKAFRLWLEKQAEKEKEEEALSKIFAPLKNAELAGYFAQSFGNAQRIDYGTGHELNFLAFLTGLKHCGVELDEADILAIFNSYLGLVRKLQMVYRLEPAGSHGVWGLDDYQFVPYLWGSAQCMAEEVPPSDALSLERSKEHASRGFLYFESVEFVRSVKKGPFHEHSPTLYDIAQLPNWPKANKGLWKMYQAEVLKKFPVVQHLYFGNVLRFEREGVVAVRREKEEEEEEGE